MAWVVGEQPESADAEVREDLHPDPVIAPVGWVTEVDVGLDGVEPAVLQLVGAQLLEQPDPASLVPSEVDHGADTRVGDPLEGQPKLASTVAAARAEDIAGETLGVHPDQRRVDRSQIAADERDVLTSVHMVAEPDGSEVSGVQRQSRAAHSLDEPLGTTPVGDEVGDRQHGQPVARGELQQLGEPCHRPVVGGDLADDGCGRETGHHRQIDRRLGVPGALEHAATLILQREDMAGLQQASPIGALVRERTNG